MRILHKKFLGGAAPGGTGTTAHIRIPITDPIEPEVLMRDGEAAISETKRPKCKRCAQKISEFIVLEDTETVGVCSI